MNPMRNDPILVHGAYSLVMFTLSCAKCTLTGYPKWKLTQSRQMNQTIRKIIFITTGLQHTNAKYSTKRIDCMSSLANKIQQIVIF